MWRLALSAPLNSFLLDEPTTGFRPEARRAFWALIQELRESGTTILLTTHYLDEAEALADRVAVIHQGKIIEVATPALLGGRANSLATVTWKSDADCKPNAQMIQQRSSANSPRFIE